MTYFYNRNTKAMTAASLNFDLVLVYLLEGTNRICDIIESLWVRPILIRSAITTIGIATGAMVQWLERPHCSR